ncbi:hydroxypyruvate isomerase family protein [Rhizobium sp. G21]|uniref:hydroxypyruvate isomerase family protein n=1 Tax=Rhizobium sp. G21 TaxID=2758439 RepID=UPI00160290D8|nr:TIM barrel protein [Rhizobium sp. G21]MBB1251337.1 TIM barrel protein [Rhizobium sp. G21]
MPRFAANLTMLFTEMPFESRLKAAAEAGFDAVEFLFPYDHAPAQIAEWVEDAGLPVALINMPPGDWSAGDRGLAVDPRRQDEFDASLSLAVTYAGALGVRKLHCMAGVAERGNSVAAGVYRDNLSKAADTAGAIGAEILIEPLNPRDMPGYFLGDFNDAAELVDRIGHPCLRLQFDIYHRQILHGDVLTGLRSLFPLIGHIQTAAVPHRGEPGSGELDDARIFRELDALGYEGYVGCEYRPMAGTTAGLKWLDRYR